MAFSGIYFLNHSTVRLKKYTQQQAVLYPSADTHMEDSDKTSHPLSMRECHPALHLGDCTARQTPTILPSNILSKTWHITSLQGVGWLRVGVGGWSSLTECPGVYGSAAHGQRSDIKEDANRMLHVLFLWIVSLYWSSRVCWHMCGIFLYSM